MWVTVRRLIRGSEEDDILEVKKSMSWLER